MRSSGSTTISPKATRKRSCRRITSDGQLATCRKGLIGSDTSWSKLTYLLMAAKGLSKLSSFSEENHVKQHSRNRRRSDSHLESSRFHPRRNTIRFALWAPCITGASPGGYSGRCSRGQEAELENECSGSRFRWQLSRLPTNGWCDARLNSDCGTQGASSCHISTPDEGLRGWCSAYASQLSATFRWSHCVSRRYSVDRPGRDYRRSR